MSAIKLGLGLGPIYMFCVPGISWCVLAFVIYSRSRYALPTAAGVFAAQRLLGPLTQHFSMKALGYRSELDYLQTLITQVSRAHWIDWVFTGVILLYCAWDYRERFAPWLREEPPALDVATSEHPLT